MEVASSARRGGLGDPVGGREAASEGRAQDEGSERGSADILGNARSRFSLSVDTNDWNKRLDTQLEQGKKVTFLILPGGSDLPARAGCGGVGLGMGRRTRGSGEVMVWE